MFIILYGHILFFTRPNWYVVIPIWCYIPIWVSTCYEAGTTFWYELFHSAVLYINPVFRPFYSMSLHPNGLKTGLIYKAAKLSISARKVVPA
jgi:hypothetical protein